MKFTFSLMHPHRLGYTLLRTYSEGNIDKKRVYHSDQSARAKNLQTRLHRSPVLIVTDNVITKVYTNRETDLVPPKRCNTSMAMGDKT